MRRVALITDAQTPLGEQLVRCYLAAGHCVAATRSNLGRFETPLVSEEDRLLLIDWNRTSPISARNVLLAALNRFDALDEALLLQAPEPPPEALQAQACEAIERAVDACIKGTLFLAKGILESFAERGDGSLVLLQRARSPAAPAPLQAALAGSFQAAARSLAAAGRRPGSGRQRVYRFECLDAQAWETGSEDFAAFVMRSVQRAGSRSRGRCFRFPPAAARLASLLHRQAPSGR